MSTNQTAPSESSLQGQYAGFVSRLIALVVDVLIIVVVVVAIGLTFRLIIQFFNLDGLFSDFIYNLSERYRIVNNFLRLLAVVGSFYFLYFLYYITLHTVGGGITIGKALMGLRVVRMNGMPLTVLRATRRYVTFILAALPLFIGLLWVIIDDRRQGWHDKLSDTCVIYDWPAQEDESFLFRLRYRIQYGSLPRNFYPDGSVDGEENQTAETAATSDTLT